MAKRKRKKLAPDSGKRYFALFCEVCKNLRHACTCKAGFYVKRGKELVPEPKWQPGDAPELMTPDETKITRVPVNFNYTGLNWDFLKLMAEIPPYADEKYTSFAQYTHARLEGEKSPINHLIEHARQYMAGESYDKFDQDVGRHLVAVAYNAMMEWYYLKKFGHKAHPLALAKHAGKPIDVNEMMKTVMTGAAITATANLMTEKLKRKKRKKRA